MRHLAEIRTFTLKRNSEIFFHVCWSQSGPQSSSEQRSVRSGAENVDSRTCASLRPGSALWEIEKGEKVGVGEKKKKMASEARREVSWGGGKGDGASAAFSLLT